MLDEFQFVKCGKANFDREVYMLANGIGKARGNRSGGTDALDGWKNIIITSGECPIVEDRSAGGIFNRILEIEPREKLFENGNAAVQVLSRNYGFGGEGWIDYLMRDKNIEHIKNDFNALCAELARQDTTEKQAANIALLIAVDRALADFYGFNDVPLAASDFAEFMPTKNETDATERAYQLILQFYAANRIKFCGESDATEVWGKTEDGYIYMLGNIFDKALQDAGFSPRAALKGMIDKGLAKGGESAGRTKALVRINGTKQGVHK